MKGGGISKDETTGEKQQRGRGNGVGTEEGAGGAAVSRGQSGVGARWVWMTVPLGLPTCTKAPRIFRASW